MKINEKTLFLASIFRKLRGLRNIRGWTGLLRTVFPPDHQSKFVTEINIKGYPYICRVDDFVDWSAYFFGAYEAELLHVFELFLDFSTGDTIVDVGANHGHHSFYFASLGYSVFAFEPDKNLAEEMKRKLQHAKLDKQVSLSETALGDKKHTAEFFPATGDSNSQNSNRGTGSFVHKGNPEASATTVRILKGDEALNKISAGKIKGIKIDTEGYERNVFDGLIRTITLHKPILWIEISDASERTGLNLQHLKSVLGEQYKFAILDETGVIFKGWHATEVNSHALSIPVNLFCVPTHENINLRLKTI